MAFTPEVVLRQLELSLRSTGAAQEEAMRVLQTFETKCCFVSSLVFVMHSSVVDINLKMLAVICLKNVVHRQWILRGTARYVVPKDEKMVLREYLLGPALSETNHQLSVHLSVLLSKVARHDWPGDWPGVLEHLYGMIQTSVEWTVRQNAMIFLMRSLKELASKTMPSAKRAFSDIAVQMLPALAAKWRELSGQLRQSFENPSTFQVPASAVEIEELCAHLTVCVNILSRLVMKIFPVVVKESYMPSFFELLISDMDYFAAALRSNAPGACEVAKNLRCEQQLDDDSDADGGGQSDGGDTDDEGGMGVDYSAASQEKRHQYAVLKFICKLRHLLRKSAAIPTKLQKMYPIEMAPFLSPFLGFYLQQLLTSYGSPEKLDLTGSGPMDLCGMSPRMFCELHGLSIQGVLFLSNVFSCRQYCVDATLLDPRAPNQNNTLNATADAAVNSFLLSSVQGIPCAEKILILLLKSLLVWTPRDIREWIDDPEDLLLAEEGEKENDSVRTAAQGLFYGLMDRSPGSTKATLRYILAQLQQNANLPIGEGCSSTVLWESIFLAAGLSGDKLFPHSFQEFSDGGFASPSGKSEGTLTSPDDFFDGVLLPLIHRLIQQHDAIKLSGGAAPPQLLLRRLFWLFMCWMYLIPTENIELLTKMLSILIYAIQPRCSGGIGSPGVGVICVCCDSSAALQAALALQTLINADLLDAAVIAANFSQITNSLCALTECYSEPELAAKIVSVISDVVSSLCGRNVNVTSLGSVQIREKCLVLPLVCRLFRLWQSSDENSPLRSNLLDVFTKLARSSGCSSRHESKFGNISQSLPQGLLEILHSRECSCCNDAELSCSIVHDILLRVVMFAASGNVKVSHLNKSALELWLVIVRRSRRYTAALDTTFCSCLPRMFSVSGEAAAAESDNEDIFAETIDMMSVDVQTVFHVVEAYALVYSCFCPPDETSGGIFPFVARYESVVAAVFRRVLGELRPSAVAYVVRPLEVLFLITPEETFNFLGRNELLSFFVRACLGSSLPATPAAGAALSCAYSKFSEAADIVIISYLHIIARAILINQPLVVQVISSLCEAVGQNPAAGVEIIMMHFIEKFDSVGFDNMISGAWRKRLWSFSVLSMLPLPQFPELVPIVAGDAMAMVDTLQFSDPYRKVSQRDLLWKELIENLAKNVLRLVSDDEDDDEDRISDDGAEYDFDSAIGGKGSQVLGIPGGEKVTPEKDIVVEIFENLICRDQVLTSPLVTFMSEKASQVAAIIGHDEAKRLFTF